MYILIDKMYILFYNQDVHLKMYLFLIIKNKGKNNEQYQTGKSTNNFYKIKIASYTKYYFKLYSGG